MAAGAAASTAQTRPQAGGVEAAAPAGADGREPSVGYDFVFRSVRQRPAARVLTGTDEFTKQGLAIDVDARIRSPRVIEVLSRLVSERGAPAYLGSHNGPEFVSRALLSRVTMQGIDTALIDPASRGRTALARASTASSATNA